MYVNIEMDLFTCQAIKWDFPRAWFADAHYKVLENILSKDTVTYLQATDQILNTPSKYWSPSDPSSKNSSLNTSIMLGFHQMA
jgi:hypothetical protein